MFYAKEQREHVTRSTAPCKYARKIDSAGLCLKQSAEDRRD
jgi:hypothetical protein